MWFTKPNPPGTPEPVTSSSSNPPHMPYLNPSENLVDAGDLFDWWLRTSPAPQSGDDLGDLPEHDPLLGASDSEGGEDEEEDDDDVRVRNFNAGLQEEL